MQTFLYIFLILFLFVWLLLAFYICISILFLTPYYPSRTKKLDEAFKKLGIKFDNTTNFIDVGSGDGRVVLWAAKKGMNADGIELNPFLTLTSRLIFFLKRVGKKTQILNKDWNKHDYSKYDIVYMYIYKEHMDKLRSKLFQEMKPGTIILSNTFRFKDIEPDKVEGRFAIYNIK